MRITRQKQNNGSGRIDMMMKKLFLMAFVALGLGLSSSAVYAVPEGEVEDFDFSFEGPFGTYDRIQLQRGLKVFTQVCSACHGLNQVAYRNLGDPGGPSYSPEEVKAYAAQFDVYDPVKDEDVPAKPFNKFASSSLSNAPDLSLMAKARAGFRGPYGLGINQFLKGMGGPEYIASLMVGYTGEEKEQAGTTIYKNTAFPGGWTAMPPPLEEEMVEFDDGSKNDVESMSQDVAAFLMWTAEPKMMARKRLGLLSVLFLGFFASLLYLSNKKLWAPIKRKDA
jgi:ubiquinol-cytochrome c reductase cytochrome c1 subunit